MRIKLKDWLGTWIMIIGVTLRQWMNQRYALCFEKDYRLCEPILGYIGLRPFLLS